MNRHIGATRRSFLGLIAGSPGALLSVSSRAEPTQLDLACYYHPDTLPMKAAQQFADHVNARSSGTIQVSADAVLQTTIPLLPVMSKASALSFFFAPMFARLERVFQLSELPMLAGSFEEAETCGSQGPTTPLHLPDTA